MKVSQQSSPSRTTRGACDSPLTCDYPWCYTYSCLLLRPHVWRVIWSVPNTRSQGRPLAYCGNISSQWQGVTPRCEQQHIFMLYSLKQADGVLYEHSLRMVKNGLIFWLISIHHIMLLFIIYTSWLTSSGLTSWLTSWLTPVDLSLLSVSGFTCWAPCWAEALSWQHLGDLDPLCL